MAIDKEIIETNYKPSLAKWESLVAFTVGEDERGAAIKQSFKQSLKDRFEHFEHISQTSAHGTAYYGLGKNGERRLELAYAGALSEALDVGAEKSAQELRQFFAESAEPFNKIGVNVQRIEKLAADKQLLLTTLYDEGNSNWIKTARDSPSFSDLSKEIGEKFGWGWGANTVSQSDQPQGLYRLEKSAQIATDIPLAANTAPEIGTTAAKAEADVATSENLSASAKQEVATLETAAVNSERSWYKFLTHDAENAFSGKRAAVSAAIVAAAGIGVAALSKKHDPEQKTQPNIEPAR